MSRRARRLHIELAVERIAGDALHAAHN